MKWLLLTMLCIAAGQTDAMPLSPMRKGTLDGIPLAQALATIEVLGDWRLLAGGNVRLLQIMTRDGGECGVSDMDDANSCPRFTLFVSVNGETSVPVDFSSYRLPETLGWKLPGEVKPEWSTGRFTIRLSACEMKKTVNGTGWKGTSYVLRVTQNLNDQGHDVFTADLNKLADERPDCAD